MRCRAACGVLAAAAAAGKPDDPEPPTLIEDLFVDLRDGRQLMKLLTVLCPDDKPLLPARTPRYQRIHMVENYNKVLDFMKVKKVKLENIGAQDIVDGNPRLTLGLIWSIIYYLQVRS